VDVFSAVTNVSTPASFAGYPAEGEAAAVVCAAL
jgi:hypothetical protein